MQFMCFFFYKQQTAYEMRISDWSSDVCSSDLIDDRRARTSSKVFQSASSASSIPLTYGSAIDLRRSAGVFPRGVGLRWKIEAKVIVRPRVERQGLSSKKVSTSAFRRTVLETSIPVSSVASRIAASMTRSRSEEHTSELQSLMRISYAVFCLKKKKLKTH